MKRARALISVMDRTLSFLALQVISCLRLTDRGLVDVDRFHLVPPRRRGIRIGATPVSTYSLQGGRKAPADQPDGAGGTR
jgi:hypothetical protein